MTNMINRHKRAAAIMIVIVAAFVLLFQNTAESLAATAVGSTQTVKVQKDGLTKNFRANVAYSVATSETSVTLTCAAIRFESRSASSDYSWEIHARSRYRGDIKTDYTGTRNITYAKGYKVGDLKTLFETDKKVTKNRTHAAQAITVHADVDWQGTWSSDKVSTATITVNVPAKRSFAVTYNANGGTGAPARATKWYGETLSLSTAKPVRSGYKFLGWNTNAAGTGTNYAPGQNYTANAALTLYARWEEVRYDMTMNETVNNIDFKTFTADSSGNAYVDFPMKNNAFILFPGLDKGAEYTVKEKSGGKYTPSYTASEGADQMSRPTSEGTRGSGLSTDEQTLKTDTAIDYNNERTPPEGTNIIFKKKLMGDRIEDADREKLFVFNYILRGLDPEENYTINMEHTTDADGQTQPNIELNVSSTGMATGTVRMHGDESAVIENLPGGAEYAIGENLNNFSAASGKTDYTMNCEVTDGEEFTERDYKYWTPEELASMKSSGKTAAGTGTLNTASIADGYEVVQDGAEVEYTFSNAKFGFRDFSIKKFVTEDGEPVTGENPETFDVAVKVSGLQTGTEYQTSKGPVTTDVNGTFTSKITLGNADIFSINALPGTARFEVTEQAGSYIPSIEVKSGEDVIHKGAADYGMPLETAFENIQGDTEARLINDKPKHADLRITKEYDGLCDKNTVSADFTVEFTDLDKNGTYQVHKKNADGMVFETDTFTASQEGAYTYRNSLKDRQTLEILRLPTTSKYKITEEATEGVVPTFVLTSDKADIKLQGRGAEKGEALSTGTELMTVDREYSFYNDVPNEPHKTVSDGDGFTKAGEGDERELTENYVPKRSGNWIYHISEHLDVPVSKYVLYDDLPPYVRTMVRDSTAAENDAPFRVYWTSGSVRHGGAVTDYNEETGEYFVKEDGKTLFSILYDDQSDIQAHLRITMEDESLLLAGNGQFDVYFKAFLDKKATNNELVAADCYDGEYFVFDNQASRLAGSYMSDTNPVKTLIPENNGLKVRKYVPGISGLGSGGDKFRFEVNFTGLEGTKTYTYAKTNRIDAAVKINEDGKAYVSAVDAEGKSRKDVSAQIINEAGDVIANITGKTAAKVPPGEYTVVFSYENASVMSSVEIEENGGAYTALCDSAQFFSSAGEGSFTAERNGKASVVFALSDGQTVTFSDLPDECWYDVIEDAADNYRASYTFVQGAQAVNKVLDDTGTVNRSLSTGRNAFHEGRDVAVTYTNIKNDPKLKIIKRTENGEYVSEAQLALYAGRQKISPIERGTTFIEGIENAEPILTWQTNENGACPDNDAMEIKDGEFTLPPGEYTLLELCAPEESGLGIAQPVWFRVNENGTYNVWDAKSSLYGTDRNTSVELTMTDPYLTATDLIIRKIVTGDLGDLTKQFEFTVELSGLKAGEEYQKAYDPEINASEVVGYTADASGKATVRIRLRSGEQKVVPAIPYGAEYKVTEAASDHAARFELVSEKSGAVIIKSTGSNGKVSNKSLATEKERVDPNEEMMYLTYTNNRDLATVTGVPGHIKALIAAFLILSGLTVILLMRRRVRM